MGNYCNPYGDYRVVDTENRSNVLGAEERDLLKSDADGIPRNNHAKSQNDNLKSANHEKVVKMTVPGDVDQKDIASEKQQGNNKTMVEHSENKPCETQTPADDRKEILVTCSKEPVQSSSSNIIVDEAQTEKLQEVNQDIEEEVVVLEHVIPQKKNNISEQKPTPESNFKKQTWTSPTSEEPENKLIVKDIGQKSQNDNLKSADHEKLVKMTVPGDVDQKDITSEKQQGNNKTAVEHLENKPCETQTPVDDQKEIFVACSKEPVQSSSSNIMIVDEAQTEKLQGVNQDIDEAVVVLEHVIPEEKNDIGVQKPATDSNSKRQKEISSPTSVEPENKLIVKDIGQIDESGRSCSVSEDIKEKTTTAEHNETAVNNSSNVTPSKDNMDNKDENMQEQLQLDEETDFDRLKNEISEKKKLVVEYNETLAQISKQKAERAKDLKNLENRVGTIKLQNELKERAFIVGNMGNEEKSCKMVTLNEGKLFKFGKGGLTHPKEKWVQLRLYPKGQVILDYAELFLSEKLERNQITFVERGEKYLSGDSSPYKGRVFAVHTTSTGKHRNMVFAVGSKELCEEWIECIKRAFA